MARTTVQVGSVWLIEQVCGPNGWYFRIDKGHSLYYGMGTPLIVVEDTKRSNSSNYRLYDVLLPNGEKSVVDKEFLRRYCRRLG